MSNKGDKENKNGNDGSVGDSIVDVETYLEDKYSIYNWICNDDECALTSDVSSNIPIEMQSSAFPRTDIEEAIIVANVEGYTSYGVYFVFSDGEIRSYIDDFISIYDSYNDLFETRR